jgi:integrase
MAESMDFTVRAIEAVQPPATGRVEFKDSRVQGLYLRVTANGVKTFSFVGRAKGSARVERLTLGKFPVVKPEEARRKATEMAGKLAGGQSVAAAVREKRGELTLAELFKLYHQDLKRTTKRPEKAEHLWRLYIAPQFEKRRLSDIRPLDIEQWHGALPEKILEAREAAAEEARQRKAARRREIEERQGGRRRGPTPKPEPDRTHLQLRTVTGQRTANLALECLRAMFNWALSAKRGLFDGANPAAGLYHFPNPERERFLQASEVAAFFRALAEEPNEAMRDYFLISLLTGARRAAVQSMRWVDVNLHEAEWRVPGEVDKQGRPYTVPLGPEALEILKARRQAAGKCPWVFPSELSKTGHITSPHKAWMRLLTSAGLSDFRRHDLRRTLGSWQARTGASLVIIGKSLNHTSLEATQIYSRLDIDPVRGSMNKATAALFDAAMATKPAEVIPLKPVEHVNGKATKKA